MKYLFIVILLSGCAVFEDSIPELEAEIEEIKAEAEAKVKELKTEIEEKLNEASN